MVVAKNVVKQENNKKKKKIGFAARPEDINRAGRPPKGQSLTDLMVTYLEGFEKDKEGKDHARTRKEEFIERVAKMAYAGDTVAIKLIWNYIDGMPIQKTEMSGSIRTKDFEDMSDEELQELFYAKINKIIKK